MSGTPRFAGWILFLASSRRRSPPFKRRVKLLKACISDIAFLNPDATDERTTARTRQEPTGIACEWGKDKKPHPNRHQSRRVWMTAGYESFSSTWQKFYFTRLSCGGKTFTREVSNWDGQSIKAWSGGIYFIQLRLGLPVTPYQQNPMNEVGIACPSSGRR